ncbi:hypothetical protein E308F_27720 [Moorella sp. E308F]|jgi:hypothetical protein|uniref:hypothetical protein n=1 Tax=Moorella sp. E308F TaxID=2572682 RepID=UPI0010FFB4D7|nr:hypothetical protein [Moorella sp. E308F]GEA16526.1 hypothetical protein E308F_27720 [Moorella sp. E308F]
MTDDINKILGSLSYLLGTIVVIECFAKLLSGRSRIPLYIALAIIIVGPVEDLINAFIEKNKIWRQERKFYKELVNQITSIAFLILMELSISEA